MTIQNKPSVPLNEAEIAFFPIIYNKQDRHLFSDTARTQPFAGIAQLPPMVPHRIILNAVHGRTHIQDGVPLCIALYSADHDQSPETISAFWMDCKKKKRPFGHATLWIIAPVPVCAFITENFLKKNKSVYYHQGPQQINNICLQLLC